MIITVCYLWDQIPTQVSTIPLTSNKFQGWGIRYYQSIQCLTFCDVASSSMILGNWIYQKVRYGLVRVVQIRYKFIGHHFTERFLILVVLLEE